MTVTIQAPAPRLELYFIDSPDKPYLIYLPDPQVRVFGTTSTNLLAFSFSESVYDIAASFSFSVTDETFAEQTVFDTINLRTIVKFYEDATNPPVFIGIIRKKQFSASMTGSGIQKTILFSGTSILSCINDLVVSLDPSLMGVQDAGTLSTALTIDLIDKAPNARDFMKTVFNAFKNIKAQGSILANTALLKAIDDFCGGIDSVLSYGADISFYYHIATAFYNQGENSITGVWRMILPEPVYEIFGFCNKTGKPQIMVRETPFTSEAWANLSKHEVLPEYLIGYELSMSDDEVFTVFNAHLEGLSMDSQFYVKIDDYSNEPTLVINEEKYKIYGYRPLRVTFRGFSRADNGDDGKVTAINGQKKEMNKRIADWYGRQDELFKGSFRIVNDFSKEQPRIGERLEFEDMEFYVIGTEHSWQYGGTPLIQVSVLRGQKLT